MTKNTAKRRIWLSATAVIITVALVLSCALAAFFYTRTGDAGTGNIAQGGEDNNELIGVYNSDGYGSPNDGNSIPSDAYAIGSESALWSFLSSTSTYGYLTTSFSITSKPSVKSGRSLGSGKTLDGNGNTITLAYNTNTDIVNNNNGRSDVNNRVIPDGLAAGSTGQASVNFRGQTMYGLSDLITVNYGTIKNLKVTVGGANAMIYTQDLSEWANTSMGAVCGINAGTVENVAVTINKDYGFLGSYNCWKSSWGSQVEDRLYYSGIVAVGGVTGLNTGTIKAVSVTQNANFGSFKQIDKEKDNFKINSGIVGGVAAINDGGTVNGAHYTWSGGSLNNYQRHYYTSYTGLIVGVARLSDGAITIANTGESIAVGSVNNVSFNVNTGLTVNGEAHYKDGNNWPGVGNYTGMIGGSLTSNSTLNSPINVLVSSGSTSLTDFSSRADFAAYDVTKLNGSTTAASADITVLGYTSSAIASSDYLRYVTANASLYGANEENSAVKEIAASGYGTVNYRWDVRSGNTVLAAVVALNGNANTTFYATTVNTWSGNSQQSADKGVLGDVNDYTSAGAGANHPTNGTYADISAFGGNLDRTGGVVNLVLHYRVNDFGSIEDFEAFTGANPTYGTTYAYADALLVQSNHTVDNGIYSGARTLRSWKVIDGLDNSKTITVSGANNNGVASDGINALGDFIAVNRGVIKRINVTFSGSHGTILADSDTAFGYVAGANYGTISSVAVSFGEITINGNSANAWYALGGVIGYNVGTSEAVTANVTGNLSITGSARQAFLGGIIGVNSGAGTLRTAVLNGNSGVTVQATVSSTNGNYVGGFIGAGVNSGSVSTEGNVLTLTQTQANPFSDWLYSAKIRVQANANSYTGLFAGLLTASPTYNAATNPYIDGLVAAVPDLDGAVGWFSPNKGVMTLAGYATGTTGASGDYVATDLIRGQVYTVQDASDAFVSKILTGVSWAPSTNIYRFTVESRASSSNWSLTPYSNIDASVASSVPFVSYGTPYNQGEVFSTPWDYANVTRTENGIATVSYTFDTGIYVQNNDTTANPDYLAPVVGVKLVYRMNLQKGVSDGDSTNADDALTLFLSGDSSGFVHMNPQNGYKALCAGASGAYGDNVGDPWTSDGGRDIVFDKPYGLDGGDGNGMRVTISGTTSFGSVYDENHQCDVSAGFVAINNSTIKKVHVTVSGENVYSASGDTVYSHFVGVNYGTVEDSTVTVTGTVSLSNTGKTVYGAAAGINNGTTDVSVTLSGSVGVSGNPVYAGGATGINTGVADGARVNFDGGAIAVENNGGTQSVLGGAIGMQDGASLSDVQTTGSGGALTLSGAGYVGGVIGLANAGETAAVAGVVATQTTLTDVANAVYGMTISATSGYKGLIAGVVADGGVRNGALNGIAAHYPDEIRDYKVPWTTATADAVSMYGYGTAGISEGILFKISDYSNDGGAEYLTSRGITVNGETKSFTFDSSQMTAASSLNFVTQYRYYGADGALATDENYTGAPVRNGSIYTTTVNGSYAGSDSYVPTVDVLVEYTVTIYDGQNRQLVDFVRGESGLGYGSYAGAKKALLASGATFTLGDDTAADRSESSAKEKTLIGSAGGNTVTVTGTLPTADYHGAAVSGGFFAVNRIAVMNVNVTATASLNPTATAFGLIAGANEGDISNVTATMTGVSANVGSFGAIAGINRGGISGTDVYLSGTYTVNSATVYSGGAIGENYGAVSGIAVVFDDATLYSNPSEKAFAGGVIGKQSGGSVANAGTAGGNVGMYVTGGTSYVGGVVGAINAGASDATVAGETLEPSTMSGVYAGAYTMKASGTHRGLIAGATVSIADGKIRGAAAHYYENGEKGEADTPWFSDGSAVSMYGYNETGDATYATGVLFKISDYSDDGNADYVGERSVTASATQAAFSFPTTGFAGAVSLSIDATYIAYRGGVREEKKLTTFVSPSGDVSYTLSGTELNGGGDFVPTADFFATYSVNIVQSTEYNNFVNAADGIANSYLYNFIDGRGNLQLYAGAKTGYLQESVRVYKPANGYVTMSADKVLDGMGNTLYMCYTGSYALQTDNADGGDNATSGGGGYVQADAGGGKTGAVGGLVAVNYGEIRNLNIVHSNGSTLVGNYGISVASDAAVGVLAGINFGKISGVSYDNSVTGSAITVTGSDVADVIFGGIVGANAGTVNGLSVTVLSANNTVAADKAVYGGVLGANYDTATGLNVTVGTEIPQDQYMSRLGAGAQSVTDLIFASTLSVWGGAVGYNGGTVTNATVEAHENYGVQQDSAGDLAAGGVLGINDGGAAVGLKAIGWGGYFVTSTTIISTNFSVFVGGLIGAMNADGAAAIGNVAFANTGKATLKNSVFALSGGMVTQRNNSAGYARYGYVTGVLAETYADVPVGAVDGTYWYIADKLQSVEGDDAEQLPAFHGGNDDYPTFISAFGKAPSDWLATGYADNAAAFATSSYGFTFVDSDDNPINYITMDVSVSGGVLTVTAHMPSANAFIDVPSFSTTVGGSDADSATKGSVGAASGHDRTITVNNSGGSGIGYATFSFESSVYALTDNAYVQYMILSFLSTRPCGVTGSGQVVGYYSYTTVDGSSMRSLDDAFYRVYQLWSGATLMRLSGNDKTVEIDASLGEPVILGAGKTFNGGQDAGYSIEIKSVLDKNIAEYTFEGDLDQVKQKYLVVSEFIAINYGTFTNAAILLSGTGEDGKNISRNASDVIAMAEQEMGIDTTGLVGLIYGMLVGVNEGVVSDFDDYEFDRTISLDSNAGAQYNSIFGGMVGAMAGADARIKDVGHITFGTKSRPGGITMSGNANLVSAGGVVGIAIEGRIENVGVILTANSVISVEAKHNSAAVGGVVGDLRGTLTDVTFESEYQSVMKINNTNPDGAAALGNLVGVINTFSDTSATASVERAKVIGVGYLYNGISDDGTVSTQSVRLYTAGVVALGANYSTLTADSTDEAVREIVKAYGEIRPAKLDSVYVDFEGYVRAKPNSRVGLISARMLDGVTADVAEDGTLSDVVTNVNTDNLKNLVWQISYEGDSNWTTSANYADYTETFSSNGAVAILGYAPVTLDSTTPDLRGVGMRIWLTNNLYTARSSVADMVITWNGSGNLNVVINSNMAWQNIGVSSVWYDESGADLPSRFVAIADHGSIGSASQTVTTVDVTTVLATMKNSAAVFPHGIYMFRTTFNEVYIHNQRELLAFFSLPTSYDNIGGSGGNQYYSEIDNVKGAEYINANPLTQSLETYRNAEIGILANNFSISYGLVRVTMSPNKILEGNGMTVTFDENGTLATKRVTPSTDDKNMSILMPAGVTGAASEYDANYTYGSVNASFARYIGGTNTLSEYNIDTINTLNKVGIRVGGLFVGRNLGTIQNVNFVVPESLQMSNENYGTLTLTGIVCAVNAGKIDNCSVTINENVKVGTYRYTVKDRGNSNEVDTNEVSNPWVNTAAISGGIAGLQYGTPASPSYISNSTVTLSEGSEFRAESQVSSFYWLSRRDNIYAYAGGVVGWLTSDSTIYNITVNGSGTITAWGELDMGGSGSSMSRGRKVSSAGAIVGLNSDHQNYAISQNSDEFGTIDGVICNWNGATFYLTTSSDNIYQSGRMNYYMGAQLAGIAETGTLQNIYFMYGIDNYSTYHMDNWYYGDNVAARQASADFLGKYDYIVSRSVELLERDTFGYGAIYAIVQKPGGSQSLTEVAYRNGDGTVTVNLEDKVINGETVPAFTFENYANYQSAIDGNTVSGAPNFSLYVATGTTFYVANQYFPRITKTLDSGGDKNKDYVGARAAAMITSNNTTDWNWTFKPNNVYIYEVAFGVAETDGVELDMNDPDTSAYLSFQTKNITSDIVVNVSLATDKMGAQFVWKTIETTSGLDGVVKTESLYYNNVTSLEQAKENNRFAKIMDRDNDGIDFTFTYVMGMAIKIAMDENRYYYDETEGVFYDSIAKVYDGTPIGDPMLYYADEDGNRIESLGDVSASIMSPTYYKDNEDGLPVSVNKQSTDDAGAYRIRISFTSEGGENSKVNTTNRTIMFSQFDHIDIYTVVLPRGVVQSGVFVSKTYDGNTSYGASTTTFNNLVGGDKVALTGGRYLSPDAGAGTIFSATYAEFTFRFEENGIINEKTINVFAGTGQTSNYAPVNSAINTTNLELTEAKLAGYNKPSATYAYKGEIYRKRITTDDLRLYLLEDDGVGNKAFGIGNVNPRTFNPNVVYDTEAFYDGSRIMGKAPVLRRTGGNVFLEIDGYASAEKIDFYFTFDNGAGAASEAHDKAAYTVYINLDDATNFVFFDGSETESMNIGTLNISEYAIQTADVTYVIKDGFLSKEFDNTGEITFKFNYENLRILAQDGYEVQEDEYEMNFSTMFAVKKGDTTLTSINAIDAGEYDIYFRISNFTSNNYTLANMAVTFVDLNGDQISYFVFPKEIVFDAVTKEFDNTTDAGNAEVEYADGKGPVAGTNDAFGIRYGSVDSGAGLEILFTNTKTVSLHDRSFVILDTVAGANRGKENYCVSSLTADAGNITPVQVTVESVSMIYNNNVIVDYRKEGTSVLIKDYSGNTVDIYPEARFTDKSASESYNKLVNFETTSLTVNGTIYDVLVNSPYVTGSLPTTGAGFAGNYYVTKEGWTVGRIVKNLLSLDDILGNVTIMQSNGVKVESNTSHLFEELRRYGSYTYKYGYEIKYEINANATVIEGDPLSEHLDVRITHNGGYANGYAGVYTLELYIKSNDYEWDTDVSTANRVINDFRINQQRVTESNLTVNLSNDVYSYGGSNSNTTISAELIAVTDAGERRISSGNGEIRYLSSGLSNSNEYFKGTYQNGTPLPIGNYTVSYTPEFVGDDAINYYFTGSGKIKEFFVVPFRISSINVTKEFDNGTSFGNQGSEVHIDISMPQADKFVPLGTFSSKSAGQNKSLILDTASTVINGTSYTLLKKEDGSVTNYTYVSTGVKGTIEKYSISSSELDTYINGWVRDTAERQLMSVKSGTTVLEYRSDVGSGYKKEHFMFGTSGMSYNFSSVGTQASLSVMQGATLVATLEFTITLSDGANTYIFTPGDTEKTEILPAGRYTVTVSVNNNDFELDAGAGNGSFVIEKQQISGGDAGGSANIFIALDGEFSYVYGESNFNMPTASDEKFVYTLSVIDKYTGKVGATFSGDSEIIERLEYSLTADATEFFDVLEGPLYVGGYFVWALLAEDSLGNYSVPEGTRIAVYVAGTPVPEAPTPEEGEGEEGGEGGEGESGGDVVTIPSLPVQQAYFIMPRPLTITGMTKTYDGNDSFAGAVLESDALTQDGIVAGSLDGVYESPNANYDSTGAYIDGNKGSDYLLINIVPVSINGITYNAIAAAGTAGNYCLTGEATAGVVRTSGAKILRKTVDSSAVTFTSDTFESEFGSADAIVFPDVTANLNGNSETVTYTADNVIFKQGGVQVDTPTNVGGYEMYLTGIAFDNYEVSGLDGEVLVNEGRNVAGEGDEQGGGTEEGGETGEEGGEEQPEEQPEVFTYYIVPEEVTISSVIKFYDKSGELVYYGEDEEGFSADVTVTNAEGEEMTDPEGNPIILRLQGRFTQTGAGKGKDVIADFAMFGYYVNFDAANVKAFYRLLTVGEDGSANVASNYCIKDLEGTVLLPPQFAEDYEPDPELGYDDTPVVNNDLVYNMTLVGIGTVIPAPLTVTGVEKAYDGTFAITNGGVTGLLDGDGEMTVAKWRYDNKDAGTGKMIGIETDGVAYEYAGVTYYAIYMISGEEKVLSDYGVAAVATSDETETETDGEGNETEVNRIYAVIGNAGVITPYMLTAQNFEGVNVNGTLNVVYNSGVSYGVSQIRATLKALGFTAAAVNTDGTLTVTFDNGDELTFAAALGGGDVAHDAGTYPISLTLTNTGNYSMSAPYTVNFVISRQQISRVYVITGPLSKEYDGTATMPAYDPATWTLYAVDAQNKLIDVDAEFGGVDTANAHIVFTRYNEEELKYEYYEPVNVTDAPGYQIYVNGIGLDGKNYLFDATDDAFGCESFETTDNSFVLAYYTITPKTVNIDAGAFESKTFDGAYSLRIDGGIDGETVIVGDSGGLNASLAGTYGTLNITPYVKGVAVTSDALNPESVAANYALYYGGVPVTDTTVIEVTDYTVTAADILVAERENGSYRIGMSGLQGLDFLFAKYTDVTEEAKGRIIAALESGEVWTGGGFDSSSDFAKLNAAVISAFATYVNDSANAVAPALADGYLFDDFAYTYSGDSYVLTFTFSGFDGMDVQTATDRYTLVVVGKDEGTVSTNYSTTSSELESGQLTGATSGEGVAVSTAEQFKNAIKNNQTFYLENSLYGVDMSDVSDTTFTGTFDGRGYTVSLTGAGADTAVGGAAGMLIAVNNGTIRNAVFKLLPTSATNAANVGGLVGINNGTVENVSVELISGFTVIGATYVGGAVGVNAASATLSEVSFVYSADVTAVGATYGAIAGNNLGSLDRVAVRVNESAGAENYVITAYAAGYVAGASDGSASGIIAAVPAGRLTGAGALFASGTTAATNVYSYQNHDGAAGGELFLLDPYTEGFIGYYFATEEDYTTGGFRHNELASADEYNKSAYVDYSSGAGYVAIEAIAPYNRFIWDAYGISYRTAIADGNVGSSLNRIVALFAAGDAATQFDGTTVITSGVNAFTVAIGVRGGNVEVEGDVETSVKEVVYNGAMQQYSVNITVTSGGVSETKTLSVTGTDAGYYSKASLEGIIGGGASGETIGDVTYDSGSRTEYTFSGEGTKVANGIALVIYPKQIDAADVTATKYYDTVTSGTLTVKDGETVAGSLSGNYYDAAGVATSQVAAAEKFGFAAFGALTRSVLSKDGVLYEIVEKVSGEGEDQTFVRDTQPITTGSGETATDFTTSTTVGSLAPHDLMIAMSRLADEDYARSVLTTEQLQGFSFVRVYDLTASVTAGADGVTIGGVVSMRPVLDGEKGGNYTLYSAEWTASSDMTVGADEAAFALAENAMTVAGKILPVDLGIFADYTVGADQSYNSAMLDPAAVSDGVVTITAEQAAALGISAENYAKLVAEAAGGVTVTFGADFFDALAADGTLEKRADGKYYAVNAAFGTATLPNKADGGNFVVTMRDDTVTFRYFGTTVKDGAGYYTLTSEDDYNKWIDNEGGIADYYAIDMLLTANIDFAGKVVGMLAWRDGGNVVGFGGTFDGNGFVLSDMIIDRDGTAALFERVDEGAVVRDLTVADATVIATGDGSAAGGIAVDNYGTIENCAFEGILSAAAKTGGVAATNYGTVAGGVSVNRAYLDDGGVAEGIADDNADTGEGALGVSDGVSITESVAGKGATAVEETAIETADGGAAEWNDEALIPVIEAFVFDERYVVIVDGKFVTDNFFKLNAVDKLFGWVGKDAVTSATQTGFYGTLTLN